MLIARCRTFSLFPFLFSDLVLSLSPILFVSVPSSAPEPGVTHARFPAFLSLFLSSCYSPSQSLCGAQMHSVFFFQFTRSRCQHSVTILSRCPWLVAGAHDRLPHLVWPHIIYKTITNHFFKDTFTVSWISWSLTAFLDSRRHLRSRDWTSCCDVAQSLRLPGSVVAVLPRFSCIPMKLEVYSNFMSLQLQLEMVRSRDVRCLSFPLTVTTLLTSTSWLLYGLQVSDLYIVVRYYDIIFMSHV